MRFTFERYLGSIGTTSGFFAWAQSNYPLIKGFMGEVVFWVGVVLCLWALLDRLKKLLTHRVGGTE